MLDRITLDHTQLKEEDRRFLLNRNLSETIANNQGSVTNTSMTLSLLALSLSGFSLVYLTKSLWIILVYSISILIGIIFYIGKYKKAQTNLTRERLRLKLNYDELFKYHLAYATKRLE